MRTVKYVWGVIFIFLVFSLKVSFLSLDVTGESSIAIGYYQCICLLPVVKYNNICFSRADVSLILTNTAYVDKQTKPGSLSPVFFFFMFGEADSALRKHIAC